jgi:hypothetical protein
MTSYGNFGAYFACMEGVKAMIQYEDYVEDEIKKHIKINDISKIILAYYNIDKEYEYCAGLKKA